MTVSLISSLLALSALAFAVAGLTYIALPRNAQAALTFAFPQRRTLARSRLLGPLIARLSPPDCAPEHHNGRVSLSSVDAEAVRTSDLVQYRQGGARVKRGIDLLLAFALVLFTLPVLIWAAAAIRMEGPGPVFYRQTRIGHGGKSFRVWKFRTMRNDAETDGAVWARTGDARITKVGAFLRRTRIDEIPQAFNVITGSMSFVGPRPERPEFTPLLAEAVPHYDLRHLVKPGLTGWAQVNYPYGSSVEDAARKLEYDLYYICHFSLLLDAFIVIKTLRVAATGSGAR